MSKRGLFTDTVVHCPDDSSEGNNKMVQFSVHFVIVGSQSEFFRRKVSFEDKARGANRKGVISVKLDIPASAFAVIRDYMYTSEPIIPPEHIETLLRGADFLGLDGLFRICILALISNPLDERAIDLCDRFNHKIPEEAKKYFVDYQAWAERERTTKLPRTHSRWPI